jgi:hypothetical protein
VRVLVGALTLTVRVGSEAKTTLISMTREQRRARSGRRRKGTTIPQRHAPNDLTASQEHLSGNQASNTWTFGGCLLFKLQLSVKYCRITLYGCLVPLRVLQANILTAFVLNCLLKDDCIDIGNAR